MSDPRGARYFAAVATGCFIVMTVAYLLFLYGSWVQFQSDRASRDEKIDQLLDRFPRKEESAKNSDVTD